MIDFSAPASNAGRAHQDALPAKAAIVVALAALTDWLFYGHGIGISAAIFAVAVACGSVLANLATLNRKQVLLAGTLLLVALLPVIEEFNVASLTFIVLALGTGLLLTTNRDRMALVALGLLLIVARIILNRSNDWLIRANLIALAATLYICSLVNFAAIIADYNVGHSREAAGKGVWIDMNYLFSLGPQALPAIDRAIALRGFDPALVSRRGSLVEQQRREVVSWRSWGFRSWRLQRALDAQQKSSTTG